MKVRTDTESRHNSICQVEEPGTSQTAAERCMHKNKGLFRGSAHRFASPRVFPTRVRHSRCGFYFIRLTKEETETHTTTNCGHLAGTKLQRISLHRLLHSESGQLSVRHFPIKGCKWVGYTGVQLLKLFLPTCSKGNLFSTLLHQQCVFIRRYFTVR